MTKKQGGISVPVERAVIYYDDTHRTPKGDVWSIKLYWLNDCYLLMVKNGGDVSAFTFTDLTTTRYEMNQIIRDIERGVHE